jgi:hypothetical protein
MWKKIKSLPKTMPLYFYLPLALCTILLVEALFNMTFDFFNLPPDDISDRGDPQNIYLKYLLMALLGPLLETVFFQTMPYYFLNLFDFIKRHVWLIILLPSLPFSLLHAFGIRYQLSIMGLSAIFMYTYMIRSKKGDPFLSTFLLHGLWNGLGITVVLLGE